MDELNINEIDKVLIYWLALYDSWVIVVPTIADYKPTVILN